MKIFKFQNYNFKIIIGLHSLKDIYILQSELKNVGSLSFRRFETKKVYFTAKISIFITFILIKFFVRTLQSTETLILDLFCPWKYEKNTQK